MVRTPGEQHFLVSFADHKALLMPEIILDQPFFCLHLQPSVGRRDRMRIADPGEKRQLVIDPVDAVPRLRKHDLREFPDFLRQANIVRFTGLVHRIILAECLLRHVDLCIPVDLCKGKNTASMIIMSVAEHDSIHFGQVDSQFLCILHKQAALSRIHKKLVMLRLNIETQAMLGAASRPAFCIFNKINYAHR